MPLVSLSPSYRVHTSDLLVCSHCPHGKEHLITCLALLFLASGTAPDLIHEPTNSLLFPSLSKNSAAQVVVVGLFQFSSSCSWSMHSTDSQDCRIGENWNKPTTTTWAAEFLLREGESREFLGSWIRSGAVHEAKKRRAKQVITCSFPCGKWLHKIGARASPRCELCRREREMRGASLDSRPTETVAHIQRLQFAEEKCNRRSQSLLEVSHRGHLYPW